MTKERNSLPGWLITWIKWCLIAWRQIVITLGRPALSPPLSLLVTHTHTFNYGVLNARQAS